MRNLIRSLVGPLKLDAVKELQSLFNAISNEKEKSEKEVAKKKKKTSGKKTLNTKQESGEEEGYNDFEDFM